MACWADPIPHHPFNALILNRLPDSNLAQVVHCPRREPDGVP